MQDVLGIIGRLREHRVCRKLLEHTFSRKIGGFAKMVENHAILDRLRENRVFRNFGGPAGGSALERASPPGGMHMTRRAFLSSKSNTGAREIEIKHACQKLV